MKSNSIPAHPHEIQSQNNYKPNKIKRNETSKKISCNPRISHPYAPHPHTLSQLFPQPFRKPFRFFFLFATIIFFPAKDNILAQSDSFHLFLRPVLRAFFAAIFCQLQVLSGLEWSVYTLGIYIHLFAPNLFFIIMCRTHFPTHSNGN